MEGYFRVSGKETKIIIQEIKTASVPEPFETINKLHKELDYYFRPPEALLSVDVAKSTARVVETLLNGKRTGCLTESKD